MANKLSDEKIKQCFEAYLEKQSVSHVSRKCRVHHKTVRRLIKKEGWDDRVKSIKGRQAEIEDLKIAQIRSEDIKIVRAIKADLVNKFKADLESGKTTEYSKFDQALDRIIRLEMFLFGEADSRPDLSSMKVVFNDIDFENKVLIVNPAENKNV